MFMTSLFIGAAVLTTGISTDFNMSYKIIKEEMNSNVEPKYEKNPFSSYQMFTQAVIEKVKNDLGFTPE